MSRKSAIRFISNNPKHPLIAIGESTNNEVKKLTSIAENCLCLIFDDIEFNHYISKKIVSAHHIAKALEWAKDKPDIIVACRAGISRSSALAYLIECTRTEPEKALEILDLGEHQPNRLVVEVGSQFLKNANIASQYDKWMGKVWSIYL